MKFQIIGIIDENKVDLGSRTLHTGKFKVKTVNDKIWNVPFSNENGRYCIQSDKHFCEFKWGGDKGNYDDTVYRAINYVWGHE